MRAIEATPPDPDDDPAPGSPRRAVAGATQAAGATAGAGRRRGRAADRSAPRGGRPRSRGRRPRRAVGHRPRPVPVAEAPRVSAVVRRVRSPGGRCRSRPASAIASPRGHRWACGVRLRCSCCTSSARRHGLWRRPPGLAHRPGPRLARRLASDARHLRRLHARAVVGHRLVGCSQARRRDAVPFGPFLAAGTLVRADGRRSRRWASSGTKESRKLGPRQ